MGGEVSLTQEIRCPKLLVVEGKDEELFFSALCQHLGLNDIQVLPIGGKTQLRRNLDGLTKVTGFSEVKALGIIRDADNDPKAAFQSVCSALGSVGLPVPDQPLVPACGHPCVCVMILPDSQSTGALEDVCLRTIHGTPTMQCVNQLFCCLQQQGLPLPNNLSKAKVMAYLACQAEPDKRLGESAQAGYWDWNHPAFEDLKNFLRRL